MARVDPNQPLVPSVLDRLIDQEPKVSSEPPPSRSRQLAQVKAAVKRDLEWLLNTKKTSALITDEARLPDSLLTYGLPDFTHCSLANGQDQARLVRAIEAAIRQFEPRLTEVQVRLREGRKETQVLRFHIDAMLDVDPEPEAVGFDSVLQLHTKAFQVQDDQG